MSLPIYDEDDWVPPPPRHRGMWLAAGAPFISTNIDLPFKPYVYNGTGEDQFPETCPDYRPKPPPKPKRVPLTPEEKERRKQQALKARARRIAKREKQEARWREQAAKRRAEQEEFIRQQVEAHRAARLANQPRPADGWQPMTGADIDALLDEIGEGTLHVHDSTP